MRSMAKMLGLCLEQGHPHVRALWIAAELSVAPLPAQWREVDGISHAADDQFGSPMIGPSQFDTDIRRVSRLRRLSRRASRDAELCADAEIAARAAWLMDVRFDLRDRPP
jgi:hypothetical protein